MRSEVGESTQTDSLKPDEWLSGILGYPAWRVEATADRESLSALQSDTHVFAYAKLDAGDIGHQSSLLNTGFRVVDTALMFDGAISAPAPTAGDGARFAVAKDREAVVSTAGRAFRFSRFHLDPLVPNAIADAIKSSWAANYFAGKRGDGMVVIERDGRVAGFLQLMWAPDRRLVIDLIGIDPAWQGQGLGRDMILHAARHGTGDGRMPATMMVGTQACNTPSVRLYESLGFRLRSAQYVLHYHSAARGKK